MRLSIFILSLLLLSSIYHAALVDPNAISDAFKSAFLVVLKASMEDSTQKLNELLAYNPQLNDKFGPVHLKIVSLLVPLYLLVLTWNAIQIMISEVLSTQASARITIQNSLVSMLLVAFSLPIYRLLINLSQFISSYLVTAPLQNVGDPVTATIYIYLLAECLKYTLLAFLILRFFVISLGVLLFPIGIFLYFFSPTRIYGRLIISLILFFLFIQVIFSLVVSAMGILAVTPPQAAGLPGLNEEGYKLIIFIGGLLALIIIPMTILFEIIFFVFDPVIKIINIATKVGSVVGAAAA